MIITHPVKGYSGPVAGPIRLHFVNGQAEAFNLKPSVRSALEDAGFDVVNPRAHDEDPDEGDGGPSEPE